MSLLLPQEDRDIVYISLIYSIIALSIAYIAEIIGYKPCILCLYQRIPYFCIMFLSILSLILQKHTNLLRILVILIGLGFVSEITLAFYHVLIEHHVIEETTKCAVMLNLADDPNIALQQIMNTKSESCAEPEFIFLKLSMAEWNLLSSLAITIIVFYHRIRNATRR